MTIESSEGQGAHPRKDSQSDAAATPEATLPVPGNVPALVLVRDGTIIGPNGVEIDFRTLDCDVWLTIKADSDARAEAVAAALEAHFGGDRG